MAYRFPCAPGRWLGRTCNTGRQQIFASTNRQSLWCVDLRTMESDEILFEQLLLDEEGFRLFGYREDTDISGLEVCDSYFHEDSLVLNFRDCAVGFEPFVETTIELPSFATTGIHTLCRGALDCRLRPNHPGQFACYSRERRTSIWTLALVQDVRNPFEIALPEIVGLDFSADGSLVAAACSNREILVIDFVTSEIVCRGELPIATELHYDGIWFDFSPTNRFLLAYTHDIALVAKLV
ncbi:MAG: hypothetical protein IT423_04610 [Pirellulaceae bacterium]|nr:hypothetical protein [Pirellulaceae bacterium]